MKKITEIVLCIAMCSILIVSIMNGVLQNWNAAIYQMLIAIFLMLALILNVILRNIKKEQ